MCPPLLLRVVALAAWVSRHSNSLGLRCASRRDQRRHHHRTSLTTMGSLMSEAEAFAEASKLLKGISLSQPKLAPIVEPEHVSAASDLRSLDRSIVIVTTAALPWMTGTAVNPTLRAAYLAARGYRNVTLMLPWLDEEAAQAKLFGTRRFSSPSEQEAFIRDWCRRNAPRAYAGAPKQNNAPLFHLGWYPARYAGGIGSIFGTDDIMSHVDPSENDVVILEEPEHINWYRNGPRWTSRFRHVIGIAHTNYEAYTTDTSRALEARANLDALAERVFTETVTRAHCDVVIQLSATLRPLPHSRVCNVHGVREHFLDMGDRARRRDDDYGGIFGGVIQGAKDAVDDWLPTFNDAPPKKKLPPPVKTAETTTLTTTTTTPPLKKTTTASSSTTTAEGATDCYFLGKALWAKGYDQLLLLLSLEPTLASEVRLDCYGDGPEYEAIVAKAAACGAKGLVFKGRADHGDASIFGGYSVFVNPSISEVLCTATAEAMAAGKIVVIARHPSNEFFYQFDECHAFKPGDPADFARALARARKQADDKNKGTTAAAAGMITKKNPVATTTTTTTTTTLNNQDAAAAQGGSSPRSQLTWDAATDRLIAASALDARAPPARLALASLVMHSYHWGMTASPLALDLWLTLSGAGPHTPWADRYPAAFRALNTTETALSRASRAMRLASARLRAGDDLALRLQRRAAGFSTTWKTNDDTFWETLRIRSNNLDNNLDTLDATTANLVLSNEEQFRRLRSLLRFNRRLPSRLAALLRRRLRVDGPPPGWLNAEKKSDLPRRQRKLPRLPRDLAARTARAAAQLRTDLANRDQRIRDARDTRIRPQPLTTPTTKSEPALLERGRDPPRQQDVPRS